MKAHLNSLDVSEVMLGRFKPAMTYCKVLESLRTSFKGANWFGLVQGGTLGIVFALFLIHLSY